MGVWLARAHGPSWLPSAVPLGHRPESTELRASQAPGRFHGLLRSWILAHSCDWPALLQESAERLRSNQVRFRPTQDIVGSRARHRARPLAINGDERRSSAELLKCVADVTHGLGAVPLVIEACCLQCRVSSAQQLARLLQARRPVRRRECRKACPLILSSQPSALFFPLLTLTRRHLVVGRGVARRGLPRQGIRHRAFALRQRRTRLL